MPPYKKTSHKNNVHRVRNWTRDFNFYYLNYAPYKTPNPFIDTSPYQQKWYPKKSILNNYRNLFRQNNTPLGTFKTKIHRLWHYTVF